MVDHKPTVGPAPLRTEAPPSFAQIYRRYAPQVVRWATRLGGPDCDAEDVVQEVFLVVSRKLDRGRDENHLVSWLFEITRKIAANHRRRLRWRRLWTSGDDLARLRAEGAEPDAALESRRVVTLFYRALHQLSEKHQTVFVLYELEGQSILAIAELTQRNLSTVKGCLSCPTPMIPPMSTSGWTSGCGRRGFSRRDRWPRKRWTGERWIWGPSTPSDHVWWRLAMSSRFAGLPFPKPWWCAWFPEPGDRARSRPRSGKRPRRAAKRARS